MPYGPENCQLASGLFYFVGAQTVVSSLQTTQILSGVCFITDHVAYASSNKTKIVWIETELFSFFLFFFLPGVDAPHVYVRAWAIGCFFSHIRTETSRRALTASVCQLRGDKECPFSGVTKSGSLEEGAGKRCSECVPAFDWETTQGGTTHVYKKRPGSVRPAWRVEPLTGCSQTGLHLYTRAAYL